MSKIAPISIGIAPSVALLLDFGGAKGISRQESCATKADRKVSVSHVPPTWRKVNPSIKGALDACAGELPLAGKWQVVNIFYSRTQQLRYAPGLRDASARSVRRFGVRDLRNLAEAGRA